MKSFGEKRTLFDLALWHPEIYFIQETGRSYRISDWYNIKTTACRDVSPPRTFLAIHKYELRKSSGHWRVAGQPFRGTNTVGSCHGWHGEVRRTPGVSRAHVLTAEGPTVVGLTESSHVLNFSFVFTKLEGKNIAFYFQLKCCWWENKPNLKNKKEALAQGWVPWNSIGPSLLFDDPDSCLQAVQAHTQPANRASSGFSRPRWSGLRNCMYLQIASSVQWDSTGCRELK